MEEVHAVDLFCGAGGLTKGLLRAGVAVRAGIDIDSACHYPYTFNNKINYINEDVRDLSGSSLQALYPSRSIRLLAGCAPCQPFSTHSQKNKNREKSDKWFLLNSFSRLVREIKPEIVSMENVPRVLKASIFDQFLNTLVDLSYNVTYGIAYCPDYGVPQERRRLVLMASRLGKIEFPVPVGRGRSKTVRDAIETLPKLSSGGICKKDPLHMARRLSDLNTRRIVASEPGGTWKTWPDHLLPECYRRMKDSKSYVSVYGRMEWDKPSPTITTQFFNYGTGRFGHPEQNRAISLREGATLQTFPKSYRFTRPGEPVYFTRVGRLIGNAVPVNLGKAIGLSVMSHTGG